MPRPSLRLSLFATLFTLPATSSLADPLTATVLDAETMSPVPGATVTVRATRVITDQAGRAHVGDLAGPLEVTVTAPGYETITDTLSPDAPPVLLLFRPGGEVIAVTDRGPAASASSSTLLGRDEIAGLPGGGGDALAAVRSMPGVGQAPPTAGGRLVIRGSAPEDTRLTVDGISVPFLYHAFNNTTILPVASIAAIEYMPGGFGVEEGRATGGVVALTTDDALPAQATGAVSLSILEVAASAAAPLSVRHGLSIAGSLRRSIVDLLAPYAVPDDVMVGFTTAPRFHDGQLRVDWRPTPNDKIAILGLLSSDALGVVNHDPDSELPSAFSTDTRFARLIASWKRKGARFDNRLVGALGADRWHAEIGLDQNVDGHNRTSQLRDDLRVDVTPHVQLRVGGAVELADVTAQAFAILPPTEGLPPGRIDQLPVYRIDERYDANYAAAYAATDISPTRATTVTAGLRVDRFAHLDELRVLPRAQLRHRSGPFTLTAAIGRYARDLDQAEGISRLLEPELATQVTVGGALELAEGVTASLGGFYTRRRDLVVEDPTAAAAGDLPFRSGGTGSSNGFEVLVRAQRRQFFGWLSYTFSRSTRRDAAGAAGRPFAYDQPHLVSAVASYALGRWRLGARWQLAAGLPYTEITGATYAEELGHYIPGFGPALGARHATAHQLDLRAERTWQRPGYRIAVFADLGNVYRRQRVLRYQYGEDFMSRKPVSDMLPLPSIGVRGEF